MKCSNSFWFILFLFLILKCKNNDQKVIQKQNVILILVDDLGWTDVSYNGSIFYETPHIDSLAKSCYNFTNAYASGSVCSPSRAALLTGKHPVSLNITDWLQGSDPRDRKYLGTQDLEQMPLEEITIAEVLQENNFKTFFSGKWHVGGVGYYPEDQGFDINIGGHDKGSPPGGYYTPYNNPKLSDGPEGEYLTDRLTSESVKFIEKVGVDPFFMMLSYYTVHTPIEANKKHVPKFEAKLAELKDSTILTKEEGGGLTVLNQINTAYASMVYALDENIGRLIGELKHKGLYDNTTIIFTSDNGGLSTLEKTRNTLAPTSVLPLRGGKGWLYEGGIRVPLLIKPAYHQAGAKLINTPVVGHDLFPTICSIVDVTLPADIQIDGLDLIPLMYKDEEPLREELFWHYPHYHGSGWTPGAAIRQGDWKLIEFKEKGGVELFNLAEDIGEQSDLAASNPQIVETLLSKLHQYQSQLGANHATVNPNYKRQKDN